MRVKKLTQPTRKPTAVTAESRVRTQYSVTTELDGRLRVQIKNNQNFPYFIRKVHNARYRLGQMDSPRVDIRSSLIHVAEEATLDKVFAVIIERHNKACKYMVTWKTI
jgi:hypothetical protein